jgi:membrane protease subunit HflC
MTNKSFFGAILVAFAVFIAANSLYIISEKERGILLYFGEMEIDDIPPGIHVKMPFFNTVRKFEGRLINLDIRKERFITKEDQFLEVDSYVQWRIANPGLYYQATSGGQESVAMTVLTSRVNDGLRSEFGKRTQSEVVSGERDMLTRIITEKVNEVATAQLGIEVLDVRVKGIDLPSDVSENVFRQIRTEREKEAQERRSRGREEAEKIKANADRQKIVIAADAYKQAEAIRGEGDAVAASVYADAYNKDAEFYAFVRSLRAYEDTFASGNDIMVMEPDSDFFKYLNAQSGK